MKRKKKIIISIVIVIIVTLVAILTALPKMMNNNNSSNDMNETSKIDSNESRWNKNQLDNSNIALGSSTSSSNINNNDNSNSTFTDESSTVNNATPSNGVEHGDDSDSIEAAKSMSVTGERLLNGKNQDSIKRAAEDFVRKFRTYNYTTLSDGSWRSSINSYVDLNLITSVDDSLNMLAKTYAIRDWDKNAGRYDMFVNEVGQIDSNRTKLDGSRDTGYKFDCITCYVYTTEKGQNTLDPDGSNFWQSIDESDVIYRVSIVPDTLKIYRIAVVGRTVIDEDMNNWAKEHSYSGTSNTTVNNNPFGIDMNDPSYRQQVEGMKKRNGI